MPFTNTILPVELTLNGEYLGLFGLTEQIEVKKNRVWTNNWFTWEGTGNKTGIRTSNRSHFDYKWENGKIVEMNCYFDTTALNMELAAQ